MTGRGNGASWRNGVASDTSTWRKAAREREAKRRRKLGRALRPVCEALELRQYLTITINPASNSSVDVGNSASLYTSFYDDTPSSGNYNVQITYPDYTSDYFSVYGSGGMGSQSFYHTFNTAGSQQYTVAISDMEGDYTSQSESIQVNGHQLTVNSPSSIDAVAGASASVPISFQDSISSYSNYTVNVTWPDNATESQNISGSGSGSVTFYHAFTGSGVQSYSVSVTDGSNTSSPVTGSVNVTARSIQASVSGPTSSVNAGDTATFNLSITDNLPYSGTYNVVATFPGGATETASAYASSGSASVSIAHVFSGNDGGPISFSISDGSGNSGSASSSVEVIAHALSINNLSSPTVTAGQTATVHATFHDPVPYNGTYTVQVNWAGETQADTYTITASTGDASLDFTRAFGTTGAKHFTFTVTDSLGNTASRSDGVVNVNDHNLSISTTGSVSVLPDASTAFTVFFTDDTPTGEAYTITAHWPGPNGGTSETTTAYLTGTTGYAYFNHTFAASEGGNVTFTLEDHYHKTASATADVTVSQHGLWIGMLDSLSVDRGAPAGLHFTFNNNIAYNGVYHVSLTFPEGSESYDVTAVNGVAGLYAMHTFLTAGDQSYSIHVTAGTGSASGESATASGSVHVNSLNHRLRLGAQQVHIGADGQFTMGVDFSGVPNMTTPANITVDWGDGNTETISSTSSFNHTYAHPGNYWVSASTTFDGHTYSASGLTYDSSFGTNGVASGPISGTAKYRTMARTSDGKIVAVGNIGGDFLIARYLPNGQPDTLFGDGGFVTFGLNGPDGEGTDAAAVKVLANDSILIAGSILMPAFGSTPPHYAFALVKLNSDGTTANFGSGGKVITSFANADARANAIAIGAGDKITLAGFAGNNLAIARYNADGSPDLSFNAAGGTRTYDLGLPGEQDVAYGLTYDPDGRLIVVGRKGDDMAVMRFNTQQQPDADFGTGGVTIINLGTTDYAYAAAVDSQGRIVIAGETTTGGFAHFALVRLSSAGVIDAPFGGSGTGALVTGFYQTDSYLRAITITAGDKILFAGGAEQGWAMDGPAMVVGRVTAQGQLDYTFGSNGLDTYRLPSSQQADIWATSLLDLGDKIIIGGAITDDNGVTRFTMWGDLASNSLNVPLAPPTNVVATPFSDTEIDLDWTDNSSNEDGYLIRESTDGGTTWTDVTTLPANSNSYHASDLNPDTPYIFSVVTITNGSSGGQGAQSTPSTTPTRTKKPTVWVTLAAPSSVTEGGESLVYTLHRSSDKGDLPVNISMTGTATALADYSWINAGTFTIRDGETSVSFSLTPNVDNQVEPAESAIASITPSSPYEVLNTSDTATGYIYDPSGIWIEVSGVGKEQGTSQIKYTIHRMSSLNAMDIPFSFGGTANASDFNAQSDAINGGNLHFNIDQSSIDVYVIPVDDTEAEWTETCTLFAGGAEGTGEIVDNDLGAHFETGDFGYVDAGDILRANTDDDDTDGVVDNTDIDGVIGENDLVELDLDYPSDLKAGATLTLATNNANARIYGSDERRDLLAGQFPTTFVMGRDQLPRVVYVEAISASVSLKDIQVAFTATDQTADSPPQNPTATSVNAYATAYEIGIEWNGQDVAGQVASDVLLGQRVSLKSIFHGPASLNLSVASWKVAGEKINFFSRSDTNGSKVEYEDPGPSNDTSFVWWKTDSAQGDSERKQVTLKINCHGHTEDVSAYFDVWKPVSTLTAILGTAGYNATKTRIGIFSSVPGIGAAFEGRVELPEFPIGATGQWEFWQLVIGKSDTTIAGNRTRNRYYDQWGLDTTVPYSAGGVAGPDAVTATDEPSSGISDPLETHNLFAARFVMYLMFKPSNVPGTESEWVPLRQLEWQFSAEVSRTGTVPWGLEHLIASESPKNLDSTEAVNYPLWDKNTGNKSLNDRVPVP